MKGIKNVFTDLASLWVTKFYCQKFNDFITCNFNIVMKFPTYKLVGQLQTCSMKNYNNKKRFDHFEKKAICFEILLKKEKIKRKLFGIASI
jgi:hypothetical protein